jgi:hypothetical protein
MTQAFRHLSLIGGTSLQDSIRDAGDDQMQFTVSFAETGVVIIPLL